MTAGTEYQAHCMIANGTATAGRATTVAIEWYDASVGGTLLSTSTGPSTSLVATALSWQTPGAQVTAVAPASATYAVMRVTVTGMAASAAVYLDSLALGPPITWSGNLLPYTVAGLETDASGWAVENANSLLDRISTPNPWEGWYVLRMRAVAAGAVGVAMAAGVPVTAGTTYAGYAVVRSTPGGSTPALAIRWYNGSNAVISTSTPAPLTLPADGSFDRVVAVSTAPVGAVTARLVITATAAAAADLWIADQMAILPVPLSAGTLLTLAEQGMEPGTLAWEAEDGCTVTRSLDRAWEGFASLKVVPSASSCTVRIPRTIPVTARQSYKCTTTVWKSATLVGGRMDVLLQWLDVGGATIYTDRVQWRLGVSEGWYQPDSSALAPEGAVSVRISVKFLAMVQTAGVYPTWYVDLTTFKLGGLAVEAEATGSGYGVDITVQGLTDAAGHTLWSLWRWLPDGTAAPVRGPSGDLTDVTITGATATAQDWEAPLGQPTRYQVQTRNGAGTSSHSSSSLPVTIAPPPTTDVVIKDVGRPARQTTVTAQTLPQWTRSARQGVHQVRGRARPVVISDVRLSRTGSLTVTTATHVDRDALWWVLDAGSTLLLQWPATWGEHDTYVQVGDVTEGRITEYAEHSDRTWTLALTEVDRPVGGVAGSPGRTWDDVATDHTDWAAVYATYTDWLHVYEGV
ncbi:hypothetical protein [Streptomyces hydrogenans]|uniref:hypothetical protein n=1 Tax=Streptomyces hydrogenans TaxID=1873719 RepID=UPI0035DA4148